MLANSENFLRTIWTYRVSVTSAPPYYLDKLQRDFLKSPETVECDNCNISTLKFLSSGSYALPTHVCGRLAQTLDTAGLGNDVLTSTWAMAEL
jgi:hypothetical protein